MCTEHHVGKLWRWRLFKDIEAQSFVENLAMLEKELPLGRRLRTFVCAAFIPVQGLEQVRDDDEERLDAVRTCKSIRAELVTSRAFQRKQLIEYCSFSVCNKLYPVPHEWYGVCFH
jgi:hypothetical protein